MWIGVDLGGTKIEGVLMDATGAERVRRRRPTPRAQGYEAIVAAVADLALRLEGEAHAVCTIGVGTPGAVSRRTGLMKNCNTTALNGRPLHRDLERALGREVRLENDANCFALSEAQDGAGRDKRVVFGVILGTGVGGGLVVDGQLHSGPNAIAGEWGHVVIDDRGPACYCGRRGCVETLLSGPALAASYVEAGGEPGLDARAIAERAEGGEELASATLERWLEWFGRAMAVVVNVVDPDVIVLGGGLSGMPLVYRDGPAAVAKHVFSDDLRTPIVANAHGDSSGVRGAARLWPVR
jgi:fructokinase